MNSPPERNVPPAAPQDYFEYSSETLLNLHRALNSNFTCSGIIKTSYPPTWAMIDHRKAAQDVPTDGRDDPLGSEVSAHRGADVDPDARET